MERKSIITWKDAIKLAFGISIGLTITLIGIYSFATCGDTVESNGSARNETWQNRLSSSSSKKTLVVSGIVADDYETFGNDSIGIFKKNEKFGYYNVKEKTIIIPAEYGNAWKFSEGIAGVVKDGLLGFINLKGETVIDFNHAYHKSGLYEFIFHWGYCAVPNNEGLCGVIDKHGKWVIQPKYELATVASPEYVIVSVVNGFKKQLDYEGNILNPYVIDEVKVLSYSKQVKENSVEGEKVFTTSYCKYRVNGNAGLMDKNGQFITKPIYNNVEAINESLFLATLKDGMSQVVIDTKGNGVNR